MESFKKPERLREHAPEVGIGTETYPIDGKDVAVRWRECTPAQKEKMEGAAVVFLPGWGSRDGKPLQTLTQQFADTAHREAFQLTTDDSAEDSSLQREARAIREFITDRNISRLTLAGHSEGGAKAVHVIELLQAENPGIRVEGLILLDPVGLYEQSPQELAKAFLKDSVVTPWEFKHKRSALVGALQTGTDVIFSALRQAATHGINYSARLRAQIGEMARAHPEFSAVRCPIVLVQGAEDPVSSHEKVLPAEKDPRNLTERSNMLRETLFPNSPRVDMLVPEKLGHHVLPLVRTEQIAKTSLYLLEREERRKNSTLPA